MTQASGPKTGTKQAFDLGLEESVAAGCALVAFGTTTLLLPYARLAWGERATVLLGYAANISTAMTVLVLAASVVHRSLQVLAERRSLIVRAALFAFSTIGLLPTLLATRDSLPGVVQLILLGVSAALTLVTATTQRGVWRIGLLVQGGLTLARLIGASFMLWAAHNMLLTPFVRARTLLDASRVLSMLLATSALVWVLRERQRKGKIACLSALILFGALLLTANTAAPWGPGLPPPYLAAGLPHDMPSSMPLVQVWFVLARVALAFAALLLGGSKRVWLSLLILGSAGPEMPFFWLATSAALLLSVDKESGPAA
jgi:hypothetical protein